MVEKAEHVVLLQGSLVILVIDIQNAVLSIILWELQALLSRRQSHEAQAGEQEQPQVEHRLQQSQKRLRWGVMVREK